VDRIIFVANTVVLFSIEQAAHGHASGECLIGAKDWQRAALLGKAKNAAPRLFF